MIVSLNKMIRESIYFDQWSKINYNEPIININDDESQSST